MLPATIDEVVARLEEIIEESASRADRLGYFAALYNRVTRRVRDGIAQGEFADGARLAQLDVLFANRYIAAHEAWRAGELPTRSWTCAFSAAARDDLTVLQHLILGMNAHINLDLGIAAARTAPGDALDSLRGDFDKINEVLASLVTVVESEMDSIEPLLRWVAVAGRGAEDALAARFIDEARDGAWRFAQELNRADTGARMIALARRDAEVSLLGEGLILAAPFARLVGLGESRDVGANVRALAEGEFQFKLAGGV
jgi:hypothetical protein